MEGYYAFMEPKPPPILRRLALVLAAIALLLAPAGPARGQEPQWHTLLPGLDFGQMPAGTAIRTGSELLTILRVDPRRLAIKVLAAPPGEAGYTAGEWRRRTKALAVINAGQYATDQSYLGLLVSNGKVRGRLASRLEALLLADPVDPQLPAARVLDLRYTPYDPRSGTYRQAAQSLMLLDRFGQVRVRRSPQVAHRTAVAEDQAGRILFMVTEGGCTLWELAQFLTGSNLALREVMSMDGGPQSQIDLQVGDFSYEQYGSPTGSPDVPIPWPTPALPAALAVFAR